MGITNEKKIKFLNAYCDMNDGCSECVFHNKNSRCPLVGLSQAHDRIIDNLFEELKHEIFNQPKNSPDYWGNICEMQKKQTEKGLRKYGQVLEENTQMNMRERLEYLEEELIDGLMYLEHIKEMLKEKANDSV